MSNISPEILAEVKERVDLVAVIGRTVALRKEGAGYAGSCPFHPEKPGVLKIDPVKRKFKCFVCGAGGDAFAFVQKRDGLSFPAAVRSLAEAVGVVVPDRPLSPEQKRRRADRAELLAPSQQAVEHWIQNLWGTEGEPARNFLASRGLSEATLRAFRVGYALPGWHGLHSALRGLGASVGTLQRAGLLVDKGDKINTYDRFRDRVMFPIAGADGLVVGFGGRVLSFDPAAKSGEKFIVGPETALFDRSAALFGLDRAKERIRSSKTAVVVDGYTDVLSLHQAGITNAVGVGGHSIVDNQVAILRSSGAERVVLLFDGDAAGGASPAAAGASLLRAGVEGVVATLPSPTGRVELDEFVRTKGREGVDKVLADAQPLTEWLLDRATADHCAPGAGKTSAEQGLRAVRAMVPFILACSDETLRNLLIKRIARRFDLDLGVLRAEIDKAQPRAR